MDEGYGGNRLANWLNERGVKTKRGTTLWRATSVRAMIGNPIDRGQMHLGDTLSEPIEALRIIDDYYFLGTPVLKFRNAGYEQIRIDYRIYYKGDGVTSQFIQYIRQNKDLRDELNGEIYRKGQLQAEIEAEKAALAHREEELQETRKQKQFLEEELERMRQRKVVRMADKVQHVIKRSK